MDVLRRWDTVVQDIDKMRWLGKDWDGAGGKGPTPAVVGWAIRLVEGLRDTGSLPPPSRVAPGVTGSVLVEWQEGDTYRELTVPRPFAVEWYVSSPGHPSVYEELNCEPPLAGGTLTLYSKPDRSDPDPHLLLRLIRLVGLS